MSEEKQILKSIEEVAAEKQEQDNLSEISAEEEKVIDDVLKEFFA